VARIQPRVEQAAAAHPNDARYLLLAARTSRAVGDIGRAESTLRNILAADPAHTEAALLLGDVLARQNRRDEATRVIRQALTRGPSSVTLQMALANLLDDTGHVAEARALYEGIVAANPKAFEASTRLAALYADQRDNLEEALRLAKSARNGLPDDPKVADALGWVYVRSGLAWSGIPYLDAAVRGEPATALFRYHRGVAYQLRGDLQAARDDLSRALTLDPNFRRAADARVALDALKKKP